MKINYLCNLILVYCLLPITSLSQDMLFSFTQPDEVNQVLFGFLNIDTCEDSIPAINYPTFFSDITQHPNGSILSIGHLNSFGFEQEVWRVGINSIGNAFNQLFYTGQDSLQALACTYAGEVYFAGEGLTVLDIETGIYTYIGDLPPGMEALGDMTFREDKLYLTTVSNTIIEVDTENPMNSTLVMNLPSEVLPITGLTTYPYTCDSIITYAVRQDGTSSVFYELDFETQTFTEICDIDLPVHAIASPIECMIPPCEMYVDLDFDDDSGAIELDYNTVNICNPPVNIADEDTEVFAARPIDSITLELTGVLDIGQEYLELNVAQNINITGSGSTCITLINQGTASFADFEIAIQNILYLNDATAITQGQREVSVQLFTEYYLSPVSTAFINIGNDISAEIIIEDISCNGLSDGSIEINPANGLEPYTISWEDGSDANPRNNLNEGYYYFTLTDDSGCEIEDSALIAQPALLTTSIQSQADSICGPSGTLTATIEGGTMPYTLEWNNGESTEEITDLEPGDYTLMVSDSNDCMASASYTLFAFDTIFVDQQEILCEGESFFFNGEIFSADTSFCVAFNSISGCDSIHCVDLQFLDTVLVQEDQTLCFGEGLAIDGVVLDTDTTACFFYTGANGCDSTYCITLSISGGITSLSDEICEGDNYDFAGMQLSGTGIYYDTLQNQNGCDSILALNLMVHPLPQISFNTIGSLCNDTEVEITAPGFSSYNWSTGSTAPSILINTPGNYSLTVSDQNNCENTASIDITDEGIQEVYFSSIAPSCFGEMDGEILIDSIIGGNPPYLYAINNQVFQQSNIFNNLAAGLYEVVIEDAEGCTYNLNTNLNQPQEIIVDLGPDQTITLGDSINLSIITNTIPTKIEWSPSELVACDTCLSTSVRPFESSTITIEITDTMGCTTTDIVQISIDRKEGIYIPNAFSPNGDGINDEFRIYTNESVSRVISFQVFNRWGGLVHEVKDKAPNDPGIAWSGNFLGKTAQAGVYIFLLEVERIDQRIEIINGEIVLLK